MKSQRNFEKNVFLEESKDIMLTNLGGAKMHQTKKMLLFLFLFLMAALPTAGIAQTYYVNPSSGNDASNGSSSQPWRTISKAKSTVVAGDIVNLMPGSYGAVTFGSGDRFGTSWNAPITYRNNPGSAAYSAKFTNITFNGSYNFYTVIEGFDVQNTGSHDACIKTLNASYVKIINCKAHGLAGASGPGYGNIFCSRSRNILIEDCEVYYSGAWAFAIQLEESDTITVRGCHVHDIPGSGIRTGGGLNYIIEDNIIHDQRPEWNTAVHGSGIAIHSHNTVIRGNIVYNYGNTRPIRFYQSYAGSNGYQNMLVENNLVYKTSDFNGTQWWVEFIDVGPNCVFRNNTFYEATIMVFAQNANGSGVTIRNNIFARGFELSDYGATGSSVGRTSKWNNINEGNNFFSALTAKGCGYICSYSSFSSSSNSIVGGSYAIGTMFASGAAKYPFTSGYPYQLYQGSRAINFGNASYAPLTDLLGNSRIGAPDSGCYEYGGSAPQNQPPIANAGADQTVSDADGNGSQQVTLNGSGSTDSDGSITSYVWTENAAQIATGVNPVVTLNIGTHTIILRVTDNGGLTATDSVTITVNAVLDTTPPSIVSVGAASTNSVRIVFNEAVTAASAQAVNNYTINGITITQAVLAADSKAITLTTSSQVRETSYDLSVSNVTDLQGNKMTASTISYTYSSNLVGYWKFNENTGTITKDYSGMSNNGTLVNSPTWSGYGELNFNSTSSHVNCGTVAALDLTGSFTITASVNPRSFGQGGFARIVDKGTASSGFSMFLQQSNSSLAFVPYGGNIINSEADAVTLNKWQHVAFVYNRTANTATFYVDGQPRGTTTYTAAIANSATSPVVIAVRQNDLTRGFDGLIDNVRLYNRALNANEMLDVYNADCSLLFEPIGDKTVNENATLTFVIQTRDPNVTVTIQDHNLPSQPTCVNNTFNWNPSYTAAGSYEVTFSAVQGQSEDFETINVTVNNVNRPPVLSSIGNKTVAENSTLTFAVAATDPDGDTITYSAQNVPVGATFNGNTFSWTPATGRTGTYQVTFIASDGSLTASQPVTITVTQSSSTLPAGLVGYWKFNETSGTTTQDASGTGNNGTLVNAVTRTTGYTGNAVNFSRTNAYVNCGAAANLNLTGSLTIDAWINPRSFVAGGFGRIVDKGTVNTGYSFMIHESSHSLMYVIYGGMLVPSSSEVTAGTWQRATVVYNQSANTVTFYINGVNAGSVSYTTPPRASASSPLMIGNRYDLARGFDGAIDEVKIFNRALSSAELTALFSGQ